MVTISDEILQKAGLSETEARIEIACRLFEQQKITLPIAGRIAGLGRSEMEGELLARKIPLYYFTWDMIQSDLETLKELREP